MERQRGVTPVSRFTSAASANFSSMVVAAAACTNLPKRVPVLANPQGGNLDLERIENRECQIAGSGVRKRHDISPVAWPYGRSPLGCCAGIAVVNQNDVQESRPVDALDAGHLNVCRGAWPGDPGNERGRLLAKTEVLGKRLDDLAGAQNAKMPVRQQRKHAAALRSRVMQNNRAGLCNGAKAGCHHALACSISSVARSWSIFHSNSCTSHSGGSPGGATNAFGARGKLRGNRGRQRLWSTLSHFGVVLAEPFEHQLDTRLGRQRAMADIVAAQFGVGTGACSAVTALFRVAARMRSRIACREEAAALIWPPCVAPPTTRGMAGLGRPRRSRVMVHLEPTLGSA